MRVAEHRRKEAAMHDPRGRVRQTEIDGRSPGRKAENRKDDGTNRSSGNTFERAARRARTSKRDRPDAGSTGQRSAAAMH
jgi:hypothetical protein